MKKRMLAIALLVACAKRKDGGAAAEREEPAGPRDPTEIAAYGASTCLRTGQGDVRCWGELAGQSTPKTVGSFDAAQIVVGANAGCVIANGGAVRCFGPAAHDPGIENAAELSAWGDATCARLRTGTVTCFDAKGAKPVADVADAIRIVVGGAHRCVVKKGGAVACFAGALPELRTATELAAGGDTACAITGAEHRVACFGKDGNGLDIRGLDGIVQLAMGPSHACAVHQNGSVFCWGSNDRGQLGTGDTTAHAPAEVPNLKNAVLVAVGAAHSCALRRSGAILCWGANDKGQLGDGTTNEAHSPVGVKR